MILFLIDRCSNIRQPDSSLPVRQQESQLFEQVRDQTSTVQDNINKLMFL